MGTRSRTNQLYGPIEAHGAFRTGTPTTYLFQSRGFQETISTDTNWVHNPKKRPKGRWDCGSNFQTRNAFLKGTPGIIVDCETPTGWWYKGPLFPRLSPTLDIGPTNGLWAVLGLGDGTEMLPYGTTAISRVAPTNPVVDAPVALGELFREGLPKALGSSSAQVFRGRRIRDSASDEFLNYQFALKPLVSDIQNLNMAVRESSRIIAQLERDSGRLIRRRYEFPTETSRVLIAKAAGQYPYPLSHSDWWKSGSSFGEDQTWRETKVDRWFSGAFTYYYNAGKSQKDRLVALEQRMHKLYGSISADTVWNLLPWSWAVDWKTNIGDVVKNVSLFSRDGLVMRYGYIMEHRSVIQSIERRGQRFTPGSRGQLPPSWSIAWGVESKRRRRATPFGFGLDTAGFTNRQWAIIGALGLRSL